MPYEEDRARPAMGHRVMLEEREQLSLDGGDLKVEGLVNALIYGEESRGRGGLLARLLGG